MTQKMKAVKVYVNNKFWVECCSGKDSKYIIFPAFNGKIMKEIKVCIHKELNGVETEYAARIVDKNVELKNGELRWINS